MYKEFALAVCMCTAYAASGANGWNLLPGDDIPGPAANAQYAPELASGAGKTLVVWADNRSNPYGQSYGYETAADLYAVRLNADGQPIDAMPFAVTLAPGVQEKPKVSWNGSHWLVVFESTGAGPTGYYQKSLAAVRVAPDGHVLDTDPIILYGLKVEGWGWALASDGVNWVVVNEGTATGTDIVGVRVSPAGVRLDPAPRRLVSGTYYMRSSFRLAYAGGVYLLTFLDRYVNGTYTTGGVRFDRDLNPLDPAIVTVLDRPISDLAGNGSGFYATWSQQAADYTTTLRGTRLDTQGRALDGAGREISGNNALPAYGTAIVLWDGVNWRVAWGNQSGVRAARVSAAGSVLDPGGIAWPGLPMGPCVGVGTGDLQFAWTVNGGWQDDVFAARVVGNVPAPTQLLSLSVPLQAKPDLAAGDNGYMLVYRSSAGDANRVVAQPLDADGAPLAVEPITLDAGSNAAGPGVPNVAWNGAVYMVAWSNPDGVVMRRLLPDGTPLDAAPVPVMSRGFFGPSDLAAVGDTFLVVGRHYGYTAEYIDAYAVRVRGSDGVVLDAAPLLIGSGYVSAAPSVCAFAGRWLVGWHSNWSHDESSASMVCSFVSPDGTRTSRGLGLFSTGGGNGVFEIGVAAGPDVALVVQSQELTSGVETDLLGYFLAADGTLLRSVNLTPRAGNQYRPRAAWDGRQFVVVFQDSRHRSYPLDQVDGRSDLMGLRVTADGQVLDPQGFVLSARPTAETDPTLAASDTGATLAVASLLLNDGTHNAYRVALQPLGDGTNAWPVAVAAAAPAAGDAPLLVAFSAGGSYDPDGSVASVVWYFGDGATSFGEIAPSHVYTVPGYYLATLAVTDDAGATTWQTALVTVTAPNIPPVAVATADKTNGPAALSVTFSAAGSYDPDGMLGNMEWHFGDGSYTYGATGYHTFSTPGSYTVRLIVYDDRGAAGTGTITVTVGRFTQPPVAVAAAVPETGYAPLTVRFSSAGSYDPDGSIASRVWDFGDGLASTAAAPTHTYAEPGTYRVTLTVTDNAGATVSAFVFVYVQKPIAQVLRCAAINMTAGGTLQRTTARGLVTVVDGGGVALSGSRVNVQWRLPNGAVRNQSATTNTRGQALLSTTSSRGTYVLTVIGIVKSGYTFDIADGGILTASVTR